MKNLTKEQQQELQKLAAEMEAEAIQMKLDYEENPSTESGSLIYIHENAEFLEESEVSHSAADRFGTDWSDKHSLDEEE
tara:strand:- start:140 stop:376 length:237 start_codon:yes stop_codon:yes gene_type:complete